MGDGFYFALFDAYGNETGDDTKKLRLSRFYGTFFEAYVTSTLERAYEGRSDAEVIPDFPYEGGESTDVILTEAGDVLFFEVVAKRMKLIDSILQLNETAIMSDIEAGIVKKMRELHKHIENFRARRLLPDIPRPAGQRIFPIIVSPNGWPRITIVNDTIPRVQREEGLLVDAEPLELLDAGEIESIENALRGGLLLGELLRRKNSSTPQNRVASLNNYLYYTERNTTADEPSPTRQRGNQIADELRQLDLTWFA